MPVPETAVDEDDRAVLGKDDVRFAGQPLVIHPVPEPQPPEGLTQLQLRLRRSGVNSRHCVMSLKHCHCISHDERLICKNSKTVEFAQKIIIFAFHAKTHMAMKEEINCLKVILADKNKTSKWLAEQLGRDQATVSKWCTNRVQPSLETLKNIAELLGVELKDLLR